jgi:hypothetical protein
MVGGGGGGGWGINSDSNVESCRAMMSRDVGRMPRQVEAFDGQSSENRFFGATKQARIESSFSATSPRLFPVSVEGSSGVGAQVEHQTPSLWSAGFDADNSVGQHGRRGRMSR